MSLPSNYEALIAEANQLDLYNKLVHQLNKDFSRANVDFNLPDEVLPISLKLVLHTLIQEKFADYLNLLYIIDVSEKQIKALDGSDLLKLSEAVSFLILKREWQKVWFRNKY